MRAANAEKKVNTSCISDCFLLRVEARAWRYEFPWSTQTMACDTSADKATRLNGSKHTCVVLVGFRLLLPLCAAASAVAATNVPQFGVFEQSFTASGSYANPYTEASATGFFSRPGGGTLTVPLFGEGGATWKLRFSPDALGTWTWFASSADSGLNGQYGQFSVVGSTLKGGIRRRAATPHHLEYQDAAVFWLFRDTNFGMMADNSAENSERSTIQSYISLRASQGFNLTHAELMNHGGWSANTGGNPLASYMNETINPAHWQEVDGRVGDLNAAGITASLFLAWNNSDPAPPSWKSFASDAARLRCARYIVARYSAFNVLFVVVGEWQESGPYAPLYGAVGSQMAADDPHDRPIAIHCTPDPGTVEPQFATAP